MSEDFYNGDNGPKINFEDPVPPKKKKSGVIFLILLAVFFFSLICGLGGLLVGRNLSENDAQTPSAGDSSENGGAGNTVVMQMGDGNAPSAERELTEIVETCAASVVEIITTPYSSAVGTASGAGSGVIIGEDENGTGTYIVTNNHVIEGKFTVITVRTVKGEEFTAEIVGTDWQSDIAVLRIEKTGLTVAKWFNSEKGKIALGQSVIAIGNPLGSLGGSVSRGIISGVERTITVESVPMTLLQIDAAINPGNSGGGLFDLNGELVGIVNAKSVATEVEGIGFAIPAEHALKTVKEICEKGYVSGRVDLGFQFAGNVSNPLYSGMSVMSYAYSDEIENEIGVNDILLTLQAANGAEMKITSLSDYRRVLIGLKDGDTVKAGLIGSRGYYEVTIKAHYVQG